MRQNTVRIARGMSRRGLADSPAVTPTSSVPWKEKPAIMNTLMIETQPPTNGASSLVQLLMPGDSPPMMPAIMSTPRTRNASTAVTLMAANQNSPSPKALAERKFSPVSRARKIAAHTQDGTSGSQKDMMTPAATSSAASVIAQLNQ